MNSDTAQEAPINRKSVHSFQNVQHRPVSLSTLQSIARHQPGYAAFGLPIPETLGNVKTRHGKDLGGGTWVLGFTTIPINFSSPEYAIRYEKTGNQAWDHWYATVDLLRGAEEGTIECFYVRPGEYDTGQTTRNMPIMAVVTEEISKSARAAELEHIADYRFAYQVTLGRAKTRLGHFNGVKVARFDSPEGGQASREVAVAELKPEALRMMGLHLNPLGADPEEWPQKYRDRFHRTGIRDTSGWHTHGDGGLQSTDGSKMIYTINAGRTRIDIEHPGSNSAEVIGG